MRRGIAPHGVSLGKEPQAFLCGATVEFPLSNCTTLSPNVAPVATCALISGECPAENRRQPHHGGKPAPRRVGSSQTPARIDAQSLGAGSGRLGSKRSSLYGSPHFWQSCSSFDVPLDSPSQMRIADVAVRSVAFER